MLLRGHKEDLYNKLAAGLMVVIENHVLMMRPRKLLHLCFDGVPSLAKTATQRSRRWSTYVLDKTYHAKLLKDAVEAYGTEAVEANGTECIYRYELSPGTKLMTHISKYISKAISEKVKSGDEMWTRFRVMTSDSNSPGEGEHKIIMTINRMHSTGLHAICSKDSDTAILALLTHSDNVFFYRAMAKSSGDKKDVRNRPEAEMVEKKKLYEMIKMSKLREIIIRELTGGEIIFDNYEIDRRIHDFVFMTLFLGNDCLPQLAASSRLDIDDFIECYKEFRVHFLHLTEFDRILPENISIFLGLVASVETAKILSEWIERNRRREEFESKSGGGSEPIPNIFERLETEQLQHYQNLKVDSLESLPVLVPKYIDLIASYWQLITSGKSTCKGSYCSKKFCPYISHLVERDEYKSCWTRGWARGEAVIIDPLTQQLLILPHQCKEMLPPAYQAFRDEDEIRNIFGIQESEKLEKTAVAGEKKGDQKDEKLKEEAAVAGEEKGNQNDEMLKEETAVAGEEKGNQNDENLNEEVTVAGEEKGDQNDEKLKGKAPVEGEEKAGQNDEKLKGKAPVKGEEKAGQNDEKKKKEGNRRAYIDYDQILAALNAKNPHPSTYLTEEEKSRNRLSNPLMFPNGRNDNEFEDLIRQADEYGDDEFRINRMGFEPCRISLPEYTLEKWEQHLRRRGLKSMLKKVFEQINEVLTRNSR